MVEDTEEPIGSHGVEADAVLMLRFDHGLKLLLENKPCWVWGAETMLDVQTRLQVESGTEWGVTYSTLPHIGQTSNVSVNSTYVATDVKIDTLSLQDGATLEFTTHFPAAVGTGWQLVRRVKQGTKWHPSTDQLTGTDAYGTFRDDPVADATFSKRFDDIPFTEFLLATGDFEHYLIAKRESVIGWYDNGNREVLSSSRIAAPHTVKWYRRQGNREDPWISLKDHWDEDRSTQIYGGNATDSGGVRQHATLVGRHGGANVFVR